MSQRQRRERNADAEDEEERQYTVGGQTLEDLDEKYPRRPKNHSRTFLFSELFKSLFNPLNENKKQPSGPKLHRAKVGPKGPSKLSPQELRRNIIERFISRWRSEVGDDFYPALRLIIPNQDRDRGVYGLKESNIGKLLVKLMKIDKNSEDGYNLLHWKLPGQSAASRMAGDFAGRCYEVLSKRPMRTEVGDMTIADVNEMLDKLALASGEGEQLPILETFYRRMNPEELMWLIRIILKQMKVGATEKTFLDLWHPDGEALFSVSSSLRRVCWELYDPSFRLDGEETNVTLMQCFQPQLAQFQYSSSFQKMVDNLNKTNSVEGDDEYWIEEKLDGERMQLHMVEDESIRGDRRFCFWSRKGKDYTYLYGEGFYDEKSALTRHLKDAFDPGVRNIILDGEMITWDMELDRIAAFGTLKTAALLEQRNPYNSGTGTRPLFRVFDILYLNDQPLTRYTLRDRRNALEKAVPGVHRRMEIHGHIVATTPDEIEPELRKMVAEASEGLVLKNPRSPYRLNSRNDDWMKVKPEYMNDFGESVDVVVIGGYYGSGRRGGGLSSFMCGLRVTEDDIMAGASPEKCFSFCKVGGGFSSEDYAQIRHYTEGKWQDWDPKKPPSQYIVLGGGEKYQYERPDVWIRPSESIVISVKAASAGSSDQFAKGITLRFPRFKGLRIDRSWDSALNFQEFLDFRKQVEEKNKGKEMTMESRRRSTKRTKKAVYIAGQDDTPAEFAGPKSKIFAGLEFCVLTESAHPKMTKTQIESLITENGGRISQRATPDPTMLLIGDKRVVKVASLIKHGEVDIIRPTWILDCLAQEDRNFLLPYEPDHVFHATAELKELAENNVDQFGDSYARNVDLEELRELLKSMPKQEIVEGHGFFNQEHFLGQLEEHGHELSGLKGHLFRGQVVHIAVDGQVDQVMALKLRNWVRFGSGRLVEDLGDGSITHIVLLGSDDSSERKLAAEVRSTISSRRPIPHVVQRKWMADCWRNSTLMAEERYAPP